MLRLCLCLLLGATLTSASTEASKLLESPRLSVCLNGDWQRASSFCDIAGTAWFALRDPGRYAFMCRDGAAWQAAELDAPLQPLIPLQGGMGSFLTVAIELDHD